MKLLILSDAIAVVQGEQTPLQNYRGMNKTEAKAAMNRFIAIWQDAGLEVEDLRDAPVEEVWVRLIQESWTSPK